MLKSHSADLRFDIENEGNANNTANFYDILMQSASNPREGQTQIQIA